MEMSIGPQMGYEPNPSSGQIALRFCKVCKAGNPGYECDWCGAAVHAQCCLQASGYTLCTYCYEQMRYNYGGDQMARQEWLLGKLQEARVQRQSQRDFEMRRVLAGAGDLVQTAASASGAVLGSSASLALRGLGALAGGAGRGAMAAWGTRPMREPVRPSVTPGRLAEEGRAETFKGLNSAAQDKDEASELGEHDAESLAARSARSHHYPEDEELPEIEEEMKNLVRQLRGSITGFQEVIQGLADQLDQVAERTSELEQRMMAEPRAFNNPTRRADHPGAVAFDLGRNDTPRTFTVGQEGFPSPLFGPRRQPKRFLRILRPCRFHPHLRRHAHQQDGSGPPQGLRPDAGAALRLVDGQLCKRRRLLPLLLLSGAWLRSHRARGHLRARLSPDCRGAHLRWVQRRLPSIVHDSSRSLPPRPAAQVCCSSRRRSTASATS